MDDYSTFLERKSQIGSMGGFDPLWMPDYLFDFQKHMTEWAIRKGRAALLADCLSGDTLVDGPDGSVAIRELHERQLPVRVYAFDGIGTVVATASQPWVNGYDALYRYTFASGRTIEATAGHRFLTASGWQRGGELQTGCRLRVNEVFHPDDSDRIAGECWDTLTGIYYLRHDNFYDMYVPGFNSFSANGLWSHNCGLGKTICELVWARNVKMKTNKPVLICTPLAVSHQTVREGEKFGIEAARCQDGKHKGGIVVTNYERLHYFDWQDFAGVVCDESSILKSFSGHTRKAITRFMSKLPYRLLATATAAPNDYVELGTSSEALGELPYSEMLRRFFKYLDDKGQRREQRLQDQAELIIENDPNYYKKLAYRVSQTISQWRLRHHAVTHFWRWVASWAMACRKPSDLGFDDDGFILPPLHEVDHIVKAKKPPPGMLFAVPALGLYEERQERRRTIDERGEYIAKLVDHDQPAVVWCQLNDEADRFTELIPDAEQIAGRTPDDRKVELYNAFLDGSLRVLVLKPKLGAWGLNWQHCNHVVMCVSHSYEQTYQAIRRCYRFGQQKPVTVDMISTESEVRVLGNVRSKARRAADMFEALIREMHAATKIEREDVYTKAMEKPGWL